MKLVCPDCQSTLQVPDGMEGKQARCPKCGSIFAIGDSATNTTTAQPSWAPAPGALKDDPLAGGPWMLKIADGRVFGPVDRSTIQQWAQEGRIGQDSMLKRANETQWQTAPSLLGNSLAVADPYNSPSSTNFTKDPGATPAGYAASHFEPHRGGVILTLGILGFCCIIPAIIAIVMASNDLQKIDHGQMNPAGRQLTKAGMVIGIVSLVIAAVKVMIGVGGISINF